MSVRTILSRFGRRSKVHLSEPFDGYPYLVTRIGHRALRHMAVLPTDWSRARLIDLARGQAQANRFETCLCLGPSEAIYFRPDGISDVALFIPTGLPVGERLALIESFPPTEEVESRRRDLRAHADRLMPGGYIVGDGLEGGRHATPEEIDRLTPDERDGVPCGLTRCTTCGWFAGECLALNGEGDGDLTPRVIRVHCLCENHNRCAGCGESLAKWRLSAYHFDESEGGVRYAAAYMAFSHRCR
jgi:hypothetical protein